MEIPSTEHTWDSGSCLLLQTSAQWALVHDGTRLIPWVICGAWFLVQFYFLRALAESRSSKLLLRETAVEVIEGYSLKALRKIL